MKTKLYKDTLPPYLDVYNSLYSDIINGVYAPLEHLPSEVALSEKYSVSRNTLRQALAILNEDGLIIKSQGRGTTVASHNATSTEETIANPMTTLCKTQVTDTILSYNYGSPTEIAKNKLNLEKSDLVLASNCIYKAGTSTLGYSFAQIPSAFFSDLGLNTADPDSIQNIITNTIFHVATKCDMTVKLIYANEMEIDFLSVPLQTPILLLESIFSNKQNLPFARFKFYCIPEYYHLNFVLQ